MATWINIGILIQAIPKRFTLNTTFPRHTLSEPAIDSIKSFRRSRIYCVHLFFVAFPSPLPYRGYQIFVSKFLLPFGLWQKLTEHVDRYRLFSVFRQLSYTTRDRFFFVEQRYASVAYFSCPVAKTRRCLPRDFYRLIHRLRKHHFKIAPVKRCLTLGNVVCFSFRSIGVRSHSIDSDP